MRVDIWAQESVQDYLQLDHRNNYGGAAVEIVAILGEERQRREERRGENDLLQSSSIVATSILQLPSFFAQAG